MTAHSNSEPSWENVIKDMDGVRVIEKPVLDALKCASFLDNMIPVCKMLSLMLAFQVSVEILFCVMKFFLSDLRSCMSDDL